MALSMVWLVLGVLANAQAAQRPEATSLLGKPLYAAAPSREALVNLDAARRAWAEKARDPDTLIWFGRRAGYAQRFRDAIGIFSEGIALHPRDARMFRHRGHRYITVRQFDDAIADLQKGAALVKERPDEIEPDGQPNARGIPTSTLKTNIYYHLGLAHYLKGEFEQALAAYRSCQEHSKNPDMIVATSHWLYMTLRRLGRDADARRVLDSITADMDVIENGSYHKLLLMYKGKTDKELLASAKAGGLDAVTTGYGVGNWHLYNGRRDQAMQILRDIVERHAGQWPAFGYIAAEAEIARGSSPDKGLHYD
jgi:tetratricopeptide (TPR) repeat protein